MWRVSLAACSVLVACVEEQRFLVENEAVALTTDATPVLVGDDDDAFFVVERRFAFSIRPPTDAMLARLAESAGPLMLPYPRVPWVARKDVELQLDYVLANLEDREVSAGIQVNGFNEFHEYAPTPEDFSQWERRFVLGPKERVSGTITELEMDELAIDLATVVNGAPNSNQVVQFQSQSGRDPRVAPFIPAVVPALVGVRAGITASEAADVVLEITIRAQDHGDRIPSRGEARWELPTPELFAPVVPDEDA